MIQATTIQATTIKATTIKATLLNKDTKLTCRAQSSDERKIPLPATGRHLGWNEEHFITVSDFASNAPAVIRLEVARISSVLRRLEIGSDSYNEIVSARHRLTTLVSKIEELAADVLEQHLFDLLEAAILSISLESAAIAIDRSEDSAELNYTANRLDYINKQMRRLA